MNTQGQSKGVTVEMPPTGTAVHSYEYVGRVLCRAWTDENTWATKDTSYVTCPKCLSILQLLARAA